MSAVMPSENWPPYRALWHDRFPLSRPPQPYTHLMRSRPWLTLPAMLIVLAALVAWAGRAWWRVLVAFFVGALAGHVWW